MYACPAVYVNSNPEMAMRKTDTLLFGTVVLLLNIILHVDTFK